MTEGRAQTLKSLSVAAVNGHRRMYVHAADFGDRVRAASLYEAKWTHKLRGLATSAGTKQLEIGGGRSTARREDRLVANERVGVGLDALRLCVRAA
ncbi:MAG: hypothetical protein AB8H86_03100 [Polyangiales bacterium]